MGVRQDSSSSFVHPFMCFSRGFQSSCGVWPVVGGGVGRQEEVAAGVLAGQREVGGVVLGREQEEVAAGVLAGQREVAAVVLGREQEEEAAGPGREQEEEAAGLAGQREV